MQMAAFSNSFFFVAGISGCHGAVHEILHGCNFSCFEQLYSPCYSFVFKNVRKVDLVYN